VLASVLGAEGEEVEGVTTQDPIFVKEMPRQGPELIVSEACPHISRLRGVPNVLLVEFGDLIEVSTLRE
jgi:hypothetical protein